MTINLILNLARDYLTLCYNYSFLTDVFSKSYKDVIMFKDTLLNNNKLSNKFVTILESCKKFKNKNDLEKYVCKKQLAL